MTALKWVYILTATDVPEPLDPLEIAHGQGGSPYATKTRIGWAVNGPLGLGAIVIDQIRYLMFLP